MTSAEILKFGEMGSDLSAFYDGPCNDHQEVGILMGFTDMNFFFFFFFGHFACFLFTIVEFVLVSVNARTQEGTFEYSEEAGFQVCID